MKERTERPPKVRTPMAIGDRAKQFAPFEALGSMEKMLADVNEGRDIGEPEHFLFTEDMTYED